MDESEFQQLCEVCFGSHEGDLRVAMRFSQASREWMRLMADGDVERLMRGYYLGLHGHPYDEKRRLCEWDEVEP